MYVYTYVHVVHTIQRNIASFTPLKISPNYQRHSIYRYHNNNIMKATAVPLPQLNLHVGTYMYAPYEGSVCVRVCLFVSTYAYVLRSHLTPKLLGKHLAAL